MAALRSNVTRLATTANQQVRQLHLTGTATSPTSLLSTERPAPAGLPCNISGLRAECRRRSLPTDGSKAELRSRLTATVPTTATSSTRAFNTSRRRKANHDSSTIDFAYMPAFDPALSAHPSTPRVPLIPAPDTTTTASYAPGSSSSSSSGTAVADAITKPEIHTAGASAAHVLPASSLFGGAPTSSGAADGGAEIDVGGVAARVADAAKRGLEDAGGAAAVDAGGAAGTARRVWEGFLDDVFGGGGKAKDA